MGSAVLFHAILPRKVLMTGDGADADFVPARAAVDGLGSGRVPSASISQSHMQSHSDRWCACPCRLRWRASCHAWRRLGAVHQGWTERRAPCLGTPDAGMFPLPTAGSSAQHESPPRRSLDLQQGDVAAFGLSVANGRCPTASVRSRRRIITCHAS